MKYRWLMAGMPAAERFCVNQLDPWKVPAKHMFLNGLKCHGIQGKFAHKQSIEGILVTLGCRTLRAFINGWMGEDLLASFPPLLEERWPMQRGEDHRPVQA